MSNTEHEQEIKRLETLDVADTFRVKQQEKVIEMAKQSIEDAVKAVQKTINTLSLILNEAEQDPTVDEAAIAQLKANIDSA